MQFATFVKCRKVCECTCKVLKIGFGKGVKILFIYQCFNLTQTNVNICLCQQVSGQCIDTQHRGAHGDPSPSPGSRSFADSSPLSAAHTFLFVNLHCLIIINMKNPYIYSSIIITSINHLVVYLFHLKQLLLSLVHLHIVVQILQLCMQVS